MGGLRPHSAGLGRSRHDEPASTPVDPWRSEHTTGCGFHEASTHVARSCSSRVHSSFVSYFPLNPFSLFLILRRLTNKRTHCRSSLLTFCNCNISSVVIQFNEFFHPTNCQNRYINKSCGIIGASYVHTYSQRSVNIVKQRVVTCACTREIGTDLRYPWTMSRARRL